MPRGPRPVNPDRIEAFVDAYLTTFSVSKAARAAGFVGHNVYPGGYNMMRRPEVQAKIQAHLKATHMSAVEVLARLSAIASGDIREFVDANGEVNVTEESRTYLIKSLTQVMRSDGSTSTHLEMYDALQALTTLAKIYGLLVNKLALTDPTGTKEYESLTDAERARRVLELVNAAGERRISEAPSDGSETSSSPE